MQLINKNDINGYNKVMLTNADVDFELTSQVIEDISNSDNLFNKIYFFRKQNPTI